MSTAWVDLYWLPLGAGGRCVRWNGRVYERLVSMRECREPQDLYHSALQVLYESTVYAVEMGPVWNVEEKERGVVRRGPVGARWLGRLRAFQYEVRCWADGTIPDLAEALGPRRLSQDRVRAHRLLTELRSVPALTWGRDEARTGEMWNSNSVVAWALLRSGHDLGDVHPPRRGRAPGWQAGRSLARPDAPA